MIEHAVTRSTQDDVDEGIWDLYEAVDSGDVLRQGDLIKFSGGKLPPSYGIVVTADCDLDNKKHSRLVTLVPLLSVQEIVCKCLAFDVFEAQKEALQQYCRTQLGIEEPPGTAVFLGKLKAFVREGGLQNATVEAAARAVTHADLVVSIPVLRSILCAAGISWPKTVERFGKQIESRGDILRLVQPPLIEERVSVAWLRAMWQERVSDIALRTSEAPGRTGLRVAQLGSPFRYRLTQMLGQVFADIGLPNVPSSALGIELEEFTK